MKFGYFDDNSREYVITKALTPYPWINYLGAKDYFVLHSNTAGGYSFYKDPRMMRLTRYRYNNVPADNEGKYFFIKDGDSVWNIGYKPTKTQLDSYECRHGIGYSKITGEKDGLEAVQLSFVPLEYTGEIHKVTLTNKSQKAKEVQLFSYIEWCLWDASDDMLNFQRNYNIGEVEIENSCIYHKTEYRERRNYFAFYNVNHKLEGFDTDRESFVGLYNDISSPDVVMSGQSKNSEAHGWSPIASHNLKVKIAPGETHSFIFNIGFVENDKDKKFIDTNVINKENAYKMMARFDDDEKVDAALAQLNEYWDKLLNKYQTETSSPEVNRMVNIWNTYQCMVTFNLSRSASYFESGVGRGMGFRDSSQDILGFVHQIPKRAKERILDLAATQLEDGSAYHQYQPLTKKGNNAIGGGFNDDPLWLVGAVSAYIKETGDFAILDEQVVFENDENKVGTLLEHIDRAFMYTVNNLGPNGLPLIGHADWNDCLNLNCFSDEPGESFQITSKHDDKTVAESVFIAGLFAYVGKDYVEILKKTGNEDKAQKAQGYIDNLKKAVCEKGYDGEWYLRAYDAYGNKVGSKENEEGKIFIEPQGMCIMGEIGIDTDMPIKALDSAWERLGTDFGMVLVNPCYTKYRLELGEITSYPGGYKENAGVFCHNNPWVVIAETIMGRGDMAYKLYKQTAPAFLENISEVHRTEPYVYSQMVSGKDAFIQGEAKNSWLTGASAWNYVAITQHILGVRPTFDGLQVDPCIPKEWDKVKVTREYQGTRYEIEVVNPDGLQKGIKKLVVDGVEVEGNIIPIQRGKQSVKVTARIG